MASTTSLGLGPDPTTNATLRMVEPGDPASSAILGMRGGGRLSTTNQPVSSSALAAWVRPAPDIPAMTTTSFTQST